MSAGSTITAPCCLSTAIAASTSASASGLYPKTFLRATPMRAPFKPFASRLAL